MLSVDIDKRLGAFTLRVAFEARDGVTALLGASGSGKSMTCRCIAGIERPDHGRIVLDGRVLFDSQKGVNLSPQQRRVGYLFQQYALFPNMTVLQNVACAVRGAKDRKPVALAMLKKMQLEEFGGRYPRQLSGGQQQRAALARMLVNQPDILLLDEPFSALDSHLRFQLQQETGKIMRDFGRTVLLVSHDRDEVYRLTDDIAIFESGRVERLGEKHAVFADPKTLAGARLTGCKNISRLRHLGSGRAEAMDWGLTLEVLPGKEDAEFVGIRMHDLTPGEGEDAVRFRVAEEIETPFDSTVMLIAKGARDAAPMGMQMPKAEWAGIRSEELSVRLPRGRLLWLVRGGAREG